MNLEKLSSELERNCISEEHGVALANDVSFKVDYKLSINTNDATYSLSLNS